MEPVEYEKALYDYVGEKKSQDVWIIPIFKRLLQRHKKEGRGVAYETAFSMLKRGVKQMADHWKLTHVMSTGLSKAARDRVIENVTRSVHEIYLIRRKQEFGTDIPQRP